MATEEIPSGDDALPAWSLTPERAQGIAVNSAWPQPVSRDWAWGGSSGAGVRVCILDSGIDPQHPKVGGVSGAWRVTMRENGPIVDEDSEGDPCGHGTACAGIVRSLAPDCELNSVKVLGSSNKGSGKALIAGLEWAIDQGFDVINMSLSTIRRQHAQALHELADRAYFGRTILCCSAHNMRVDSYPWRFSSVLSVASHADADPLRFLYNPEPPVEFYARGVDLEIAWAEGATIRATGNSFATPHLAGICALVLGKHPGLTPFEVKSILYLTADNVESGDA